MIFALYDFLVNIILHKNREKIPYSLNFIQSNVKLFLLF